MNLTFICRKQGENCLFFKGYGRGIVSMVEQWSPKPEVKGSNPFSPDLFIWLFSVLSPPFLLKKPNKKTKLFGFCRSLLHKPFLVCRPFLCSTPGDAYPTLHFNPFFRRYKWFIFFFLKISPLS